MRKPISLFRNRPGVLDASAFSLLTDRSRGCIDSGVTGSIFLTGACLLPGTGPKRIDFSGELNIPNTTASASLVASVTVGSAPAANLRVVDVFADLLASPENPTRRSRSGAGGGPHFLPRRPIERARASCILYSVPSSVKRSERLNRNFSFRFPGNGGASMSAYGWYDCSAALDAEAKRADVVREEDARPSLEEEGIDDEGWFFNGARRRVRVSVDASCHAVDDCTDGGADVRDLNSSYLRLRGSRGLDRRCIPF